MDRPLMRASALLAEARETIEAYREKQQETFDEKSEKWQESAAGEALTNRISELEDIALDIETLEDRIKELIMEEK